MTITVERNRHVRVEGTPEELDDLGDVIANLGRLTNDTNIQAGPLTIWANNISLTISVNQELSFR
jgi:hypothetical protein